MINSGIVTDRNSFSVYPLYVHARVWGISGKRVTIGYRLRLGSEGRL